MGLFAGSVAIPVRAAPAESGPEPPPDTLQEIVVTAQKSPVQRLIDRQVYDVTVDLQSTTGTAADILNDIPSVVVDADGVVSLRGDSNVTILIDGKPSALLTGAAAADGLLQLPASEIAKVEILTNPPAQFKADGAAGVINIVTKKASPNGPLGTIQASAGNDERYVLSASGNYNTGPMNFSGGIGLRQDDRQRNITDRRAAIDPTTQNLVLSQEDLDEHVRRLIPSVNAAMHYQIDDSQSLGLTLSRRERFGDRRFIQHDESALTTGPPTSISDRNSVGQEWRLDSGEKIQFDQKLTRPEETLSIALQHSLVSEREHYDYANIYIVPVAVPSYDDLNLSLDLATTEFTVDYSLPLSNNRMLKLGFDFQEDHDDFGNSGDTVDPITGTRILIPAITNFFKYQQQIDSIYASYQTSIQAWSLQAGLRVEETTPSFPDVTGAGAINHRYTRAYPSLHLDRALSVESTLSLSLGRRVTRPDPEAFNPYIDRQDTHNLRAGNPNLLPEDTQSFEIGYSVDTKGLSYGLTGYLRRNRNSVTDVTEVMSADVVLIAKENLAKDNAAGLEFTANGRFTSTLSYGVSGNLFHDQIDATALAATGLKSTTGLNAKASLDYHPTAADTAQISFTRSDKRLTPQGFVGAINLVNLGFRHQIHPHLSAIITVSNLFNGQILHRFVATPTLTDRYEREQVGQVAYVGIVYAFGASKKAKPNGFDFDKPAQN
ncbi:MAG: TonB-dependent receptor [Pseudomonadota bacterium]|nr:TonB-dependent receptor [Pseudomonadota bacterium]